MREDLIEMLLPTVEIALYGIGGLIAAGIGIGFEYLSYLHVIAGEYPLAAYLGVLGIAVLTFAYLITVQKLLPTIQAA